MRYFLPMLLCCLLTACVHAPTANEVKKPWRFPTEQLVAERLFLCAHTEKGGPSKIFAARLECKPLKLPDVNWNFERDRIEDVHISLGFSFDHADINKLKGVVLSQDVLRQTDGEDSVYLFGQHLDVEPLEVRFGEVVGDTIQVEIRLRIDLSYVEKGWVETRLSAPAVIEDRDRLRAGNSNKAPEPAR